MNLSHCHIQSKNLDHACRFYEDLFEFKVEFRDKHRAFLKNQFDFVLCIEFSDTPELLPKWFHLGFDTKTEVKLHDVFIKLKNSKDCVLGVINTAGDPMNFYCVDPDGNRIEVYCRI